MPALIPSLNPNTAGAGPDYPASLEGIIQAILDTSAQADLVAMHALATSLNGYVDGLEGYVDGLEGLMTALNGYVDGLEGLLGGTLTVKKLQNDPTWATVTSVAATAASLMAADATRNGARIVNYLSSPIYIVKATSGTPASGAGSDYVPPAIGGIPGQYEFAFRPVAAYQYVCAAAGGFTLITW